MCLICNKQYTFLNIFKNSLKPDINSIEKSVDPYQLTPEEAS